MQAKKMASCHREMFIWSKLGQKRPGMEVGTFCKDKESNLGPVAGC